MHFGDAAPEIDAAWRAAEDGDCPRVERHLRKAEAEDTTGEAKRVRAQIVSDCRRRALSGPPPDGVRRAWWAVVGLLVGVWLGSRVVTAATPAERN